MVGRDRGQLLLTSHSVFCPEKGVGERSEKESGTGKF